MILNEEFGRLVRIFVNQTEAAKGTPGGLYDRLLDAEVLSYKVMHHAVSAAILNHGTKMDDFGFETSFQDVFSVLGLARMCHEAFVLFNHLFVTPQTPEEAECRYLAWRYVDTRKQSRYQMHSSEDDDAGQAHLREMKKRKEEIKEQVISLKEKLNANSAFVRMAIEDRKRILKDLKWPLSSWPDLGIQAGFNEFHARQVYRYLCSYAHPGSLGIQQVRFAPQAKMLGHLSNTGVKHGAVLIACLVQDFSKVFERASVVLEVDSVGRRLVEFYAGLARGTY